MDANGSDYTIRLAEKVDLDHLAELLLALQDHLETSNPELWRKKAESRSQIRSQLSSRLVAPFSCVLVAEHKVDGIVGVAFGRVVANKRYTPSQSGSVDQVFVSEEHRRSGVGSQLVAELCRFFSDQGVDDISLRYVVGNNEAAAFWETLGFRPRIITAGAIRVEIEARLAHLAKGLHDGVAI